MLGAIAEVALENATLGFDKKYSYALPSDIKATTGCRVVVPFGKANIQKQGIILNIIKGETENLKTVKSAIDETPVLNSELLLMCEYMKAHYFCTYYDAVKAILPAGISYRLKDYYSVNPLFADSSLLENDEAELFKAISSSGEVYYEKLKGSFDNLDEILASLVIKQAVFKNCSPVRNLNDATMRFVRLTVSEEDLSSVKLTPRQREIAEIVANLGEVSVKELQYFTGVTLSVINALRDKRVLAIFEKEVFRTPYRTNENANPEEIKLTEEQQTAFDGMVNEIKSGKSAVSLLYGVTGSGKTKVFLKLTDYVKSIGKGVILMVPEIALTPQMINIFSSRYGKSIAVFHSAMSAGQRMDEWKRINSGEATIAIGTRSAIFAPVKNLGLIIMDEEQEHTYKSERAPKFHARDLSKFRAAHNNCLVCLASATPSLESYSAAKSGRYSLYTLKNRYGNAVLPTVETVDMKREMLNGNATGISERLCEAIKENLENKKQTIVLLNRRGYNTYISCPNCGNVETCPNCSISLTYHTANKRLMCHYCGYSVPYTKTCTNCGGEHLKFTGMGTQKISEQLSLLFPEAKIIRVDADSTATRESLSNYLNDFSNGKYDIMVGTQMVAKGLDFPNVTLVGVIGADASTYREDYKSFERTFSLLTQVVGRAGRGEIQGKAIIQTNNPEENIIELAKNQDYETFYEEEILTRRLMTYPPYCDICMVSATSVNSQIANDTINAVLKNIKKAVENEYKDIKLIILGPSSASVSKINNRYRFKMLIKCKNDKRFREMISAATCIPLKMDASVAVDMNPETCI